MKSAISSDLANITRNRCRTSSDIAYSTRKCRTFLDVGNITGMSFKLKPTSKGIVEHPLQVADITGMFFLAIANIM
jgi:hypothetical protein